MNIQTQNSMIHLLVYDPNKGLGLCAYGYGGLLHHVELLVKRCQLAAVGEAYCNLLPRAQGGGDRPTKVDLEKCDHFSHHVFHFPS